MEHTDQLSDEDARRIDERDLEEGDAETCPEDGCNEIRHRDLSMELHLVNDHDHFPPVEDIGRGER